MTNEPERWLNGGSAAERELLEVLGSERPPAELSARMRAVVLAPVLTTLASVSSTGGPAAGVGGAGALGATAVSGTAPAAGAAGAMSATTKWLGLGAGTIALGALVSVGFLGLGSFFGGSAEVPVGVSPASIEAPAAETSGAETRGLVLQETEIQAVDTMNRGPDASGATATGEEAPAVSIAREPATKPGGSSDTKGAARPAIEMNDSGSLSRELAILERARRAVEQSDRQAALGFLATYRARFPEGQLKSEALVLEQRARAVR